MEVYKKKSFLSKYIYLIPAVLLMLLFFVWPIVLTIYYSFTNLALTGSAASSHEFVALENYKKNAVSFRG